MLRTAVACVLLALVSSSAFALSDSYQEPRRTDRGQVIDGRYVAPGGDRNHIYNGKRVLVPGEVRQGREVAPYSQRRNEYRGNQYRSNEYRSNHMRDYQQQRQR